MVGIAVRAVQFVECDVVVREDAIAGMNLLVDALAQFGIKLIARQSGQFVNPFVHGSSAMIVHPSLIAEDARFHIVQIVLSALFELGQVSFLLELLSLQVVARVKLIADGERHNVQLAQRFDDCRSAVGSTLRFTQSSHREHLQHRFLRAVVRILGTAFALRNPDVLMFLCDSIMNITAHKLTGAQHFLGRESSSDGEGFIHAHQPLDPRINKQIVADANLHSSLMPCLHQFHVKQGRVEHDVTMIRKEGVSGMNVTERWKLGAMPFASVSQCTVIEGTAIGVLTYDVFDDRLHEAHLEVERCLHAYEGHSHQPVPNVSRQPGSESLQHHIELSVVQHVLESLLHLLRLIRANLVKLRIED